MGIKTREISNHLYPNETPRSLWMQYIHHNILGRDGLVQSLGELI